jgi:6-pyruvoyltetrahydropterin/6-carboxytetrahydropterin synthase
MPYRITCAVEIESGHALSKHPGPCRFPHGHSRRIEVTLESDRLDAHDMVCDFKHLDDAVRAAAARYDHALCLNTRDPHFDPMRELSGERIVGFEDEDPTTEVLARRLHLDLPPLLPGGVRIVRVRVSETRDCWAEYFETP